MVLTYGILFLGHRFTRTCSFFPRRFPVEHNREHTRIGILNRSADHEPCTVGAVIRLPIRTLDPHRRQNRLRGRRLKDRACAIDSCSHQLAVRCNVVQFLAVLSLLVLGANFELTPVEVFISQSSRAFVFGSCRSNTACYSLFGESAKPMYSPGSPTVPRRWPPRVNQVNWVTCCHGPPQ